VPFNFEESVLSAADPLVDELEVTVNVDVIFARNEKEEELVELFKLPNPPKPVKSHVFPATPMARRFADNFRGLFQHFLMGFLDNPGLFGLLLMLPVSVGQFISSRLLFVCYFLISDFSLVESEGSYKPEFDRTGTCNSLGKKLVEVLDLRVVIQIGLEKSHPVIIHFFVGFRGKFLSTADPSADQFLMFLWKMM
jgi:hypothetical protein